MFRPLLFCLLLWLPVVALPQSPATDASPGAVAMARGIALFQEGKPERALAYLQDAARLGIASPALKYNLGVVHYRLGQYLEAADWFRQLLDTEHEALARYNLGLVALAAGQDQQATDWFQSVVASDEPRLSALAERQLEQLYPRNDVEPSPDVQGYATGGVGYDSNVSALPDSQSSGQGSTFAEAILAGAVATGRLGDWQTRLDAAWYERQYERRSEGDTRVLQTGVSGRRPLADWQVGARLGVARSWLGNQSLDTRGGMEVFAEDSPCAPVRGLDRCELSLAAEQVWASRPYEAYDGQWYRLQARGWKATAAGQLEGWLRIEQNRRRDLRQGEQFLSVSPTHYEALIRLSHSVHSRLTLGTGLSARLSRFADPNREFDGQTLTEERRRERRWQAEASADYQLTDTWLVRGEWRYQNQQSTISRYEYRRQVLLVSLEALL
ncbi:MAG TPA: tetratricopeptide repeat protein [Marinobacter sp.]|nr:tetratricopeptide repeat protein [Marinobacter sp.]